MLFNFVLYHTVVASLHTVCEVALHIKYHSTNLYVYTRNRTASHPFDYRNNDILGTKFQRFGITAAHPDTEDVHYNITVIIQNGK